MAKALWTMSKLYYHIHHSTLTLVYFSSPILTFQKPGREVMPLTSEVQRKAGESQKSTQVGLLSTRAYEHNLPA